MERLTKRLDGSIIFPAELLDVTLLPDNETMYKLLTRLAAYEDTGLEPERISQIVKELQAYRALGTLDELLELALAKDEGRLVVLPENDGLVRALE